MSVIPGLDNISSEAKKAAEDAVAAIERLSNTIFDRGEAGLESAHALVTSLGARVDDLIGKVTSTIEGAGKTVPEPAPVAAVEPPPAAETTPETGDAEQTGTDETAETDAEQTGTDETAETDADAEQTGAEVTGDGTVKEPPATT